LRTARASLLAFALCWAVVAGAQVLVPPLGGRVTDQTATLTNEQKTALEDTLRSFEDRKGSQVTVLIVPSTAPETIEQYALRVAERWKLGRKNVDDGALLVVAKDDRTLRIEVGYGLEGVLTDAACKRIISEIIVPRFRQGDFYGGITAGVDRILRVVDGEPLPKPEERRTGGGIGSFLPVLMILALVVGAVLHTVLGRFPGALVTGGAVSVVAWMLVGAVSVALIAGAIAFLFTLLGGGVGGHGLGRGGFGGGFGGAGFGGGGFGGGGFGGGGFSGGGGGFGGGGASGSW